MHLVCTLHGLPLAWALTGAKANERDVVNHLLDTTAALQDRPTRRRQIIIADKGYSGREFETGLTEVGIDLLRPARKGEKPRPGQRFFKPLRQIEAPRVWWRLGYLGPAPTGTCSPT